LTAKRIVGYGKLLRSSHPYGNDRRAMGFVGLDEGGRESLEGLEGCRKVVRLS